MGFHYRTTRVQRPSHKINTQRHMGHCGQTHQIWIFHPIEKRQHVKTTSPRIHQGDIQQTWST